VIINNSFHPIRTYVPHWLSANHSDIFLNLPQDCGIFSLSRREVSSWSLHYSATKLSSLCVKELTSYVQKQTSTCSAGKLLFLAWLAKNRLIRFFKVVRLNCPYFLIFLLLWVQLRYMVSSMESRFYTQMVECINGGIFLVHTFVMFIKVATLNLFLLISVWFSFNCYYERLTFRQCPFVNWFIWSKLLYNWYVGEIPFQV
jgi:hypothetical protein